VISLLEIVLLLFAFPVPVHFEIRDIHESGGSQFPTGDRSNFHC